MSKQPKLVLRESCVADVSRNWVPSAFVEMGAGTGGMTRIFLNRGFYGACHDLGDVSRELIRKNLAQFGGSIQVVDRLDRLPLANFDYLFAFEVLEHIEDDLAALTSWSRHLKQQGKLLVSVPAHQRRFGLSDKLVGHVRRYERKELEDLMSAAGFKDIKIFNYGFPVTELTRPISNFLVRNDRSYDGMSAEERSIRSAQVKPKAISDFLSMLSGRVVLPFCWIQRLFYSLDFGDGYVATAVKR